mmetsp:Transcript_50157/g.132002  ORF Transcript_50157/g.132002 Transcript_50157/m.132002 type:complete len:478 (+) Transcript_50157:177-1610(+)
MARRPPHLRPSAALPSHAHLVPARRGRAPRHAPHRCPIPTRLFSAHPSGARGAPTHLVSHGLPSELGQFCVAGQREAHRALRVRERARCHLVRRLRALRQDLGQVRLLRDDLLVALLQRLQVGNRGLRQERLERAPPRPRLRLRRDLLARHARHRLVDAEQVVRLGPVVGVHDALGRVGLAALDLARNLVGRVEEVDARRVVLGALGHLGGAVLQAHHARIRLLDESLRLNERLLLLVLAVLVVEAARNVTRELEVLPLVLAHGDELRLVEQDVRRHQHRVAKQAHANRLAVARARFLLRLLLLELDHALQPAHRRRAVEQPRQLRVRRHVRLHKHLGALRINSAREIQRGGAVRVLRELLGRVRRGDRVQVDHAEIVVVLLLILDPLPNRTQIVAQVQHAGRLHAREHALPHTRGIRRLSRRCCAVRRRWRRHGAISAHRQRPSARRGQRLQMRDSARRDRGPRQRQADRRQVQHG